MMALVSFDLSFVLSVEDRIRAQAAVDGVAQKRDDRTLYFLSRPGLNLAIVAIRAVAGGALIIWLAPYLWRLLTGDPSDLLSPKALLCLAVVSYVTWRVGRDIYQLATRRRRPDLPGGAGREGVHWGQHHLKADVDGLSVQLASCGSVYRWTAITEIRRTKDLLLLILTPRSMITIPRRAFGDEAEAQAFCTLVEDRIQNEA